MNLTVMRTLVWLLRLAVAALAIGGAWLMFALPAGLTLIGLGALAAAVLGFWLQHSLNWLYPARQVSTSTGGRNADGTLDLNHPSNAAIRDIMLHMPVANQD